jgi:hypothetical protein
VPVSVIHLGLLGFLFFRHQRKNRVSDYADPPTAARQAYKGDYGSPPIGLGGYGRGGLSAPGQQSPMSELAGHEGPVSQVRHEMPAHGLN